MKTKPVTAGTDPTIHIQLVDFCIRIYLAHKPNIERCISSNQGRLGLYAEIQIILGTESGPNKNLTYFFLNLESDF